MLLARIAYADWWYTTQAADEKFMRLKEESEIHEDESFEDLGDFVEAMQTLRTFGPNPKAFDPPIHPPVPDNPGY
jgi:hypothetical protein